MKEPAAPNSRFDTEFEADQMQEVRTTFCFRLDACLGDLSSFGQLQSTLEKLPPRRETIEFISGSDEESTPPEQGRGTSGKRKGRGRRRRRPQSSSKQLLVIPIQKLLDHAKESVPPPSVSSGGIQDFETAFQAAVCRMQNDHRLLPSEDPAAFKQKKYEVIMDYQDEIQSCSDTLAKIVRSSMSLALPDLRKDFVLGAMVLANVANIPLETFLLQPGERSGFSATGLLRVEDNGVPKKMSQEDVATTLLMGEIFFEILHSTAHKLYSHHVNEGKQDTKVFFEQSKDARSLRGYMPDIQAILSQSSHPQHLFSPIFFQSLGNLSRLSDYMFNALIHYLEAPSVAENFFHPASEVSPSEETSWEDISADCLGAIHRCRNQREMDDAGLWIRLQRKKHVGLCPKDGALIFSFNDVPLSFPSGIMAHCRCMDHQTYQKISSAEKEGPSRERIAHISETDSSYHSVILPDTLYFFVGWDGELYGSLSRFLQNTTLAETVGEERYKVMQAYTLYYFAQHSVITSEVHQDSLHHDPHSKMFHPSRNTTSHQNEFSALPGIRHIREHGSSRLPGANSGTTVLQRRGHPRLLQHGFLPDKPRFQASQEKTSPLYACVVNYSQEEESQQPHLICINFKNKRIPQGLLTEAEFENLSQKSPGDLVPIDYEDFCCLNQQGEITNNCVAGRILQQHDAPEKHSYVRFQTSVRAINRSQDVVDGVGQNTGRILNS